MRVFDTTTLIIPREEAVLFDDKQYDEYVRKVTNRFSLIEAVYPYDDNGLGVMRMLTPIIMVTPRCLTMNKQGIDRGASVVYCAYVAHNGSEFLAVSGFLTGDERRFEEKEVKLKKLLVAAVRGRWGLLQRAEASA